MTISCFDCVAQAADESDASERVVAFSGELFELEQNIARTLASFAGAPEMLSLTEARNAVALCLAIDEAGRTGEPVSLPDYWSGGGSRLQI